MAVERRLYPRIEVDLDGRMMLEGSGQPLGVRVSNLSVTGAAVESEIGPDPGKLISSLEFALPAVNPANGEPGLVSLDVAARVSRRILVAPGANEEPGYILGVEFQNLIEPVQRMIRRFVFQRIIDTKPANNTETSPKRIERVPYRQPITLSYDWFGEFETQLTENLSVDGTFIRSTRPYPPGTVFDFQLLLRDDFTLVKGLGEVVWIREREGNPGQPAGMGVRFLDLDETGRKVIHKVISHHLDEEAAHSGAASQTSNATTKLPAQRPQDVPAIPVAVAGDADTPETLPETAPPAPRPAATPPDRPAAPEVRDPVKALPKPDRVEPEEPVESPAVATESSPEPDEALPVSPIDPETVAQAASSETPVYGSASLRRRARWPWLLIVMLLLVALAAGAFLRDSLAPPRQPEPTEQPAALPSAAPGDAESEVAPTPPPEETALAFVQAWAAAWSAQSTDEYLGYYSPEFETPANLGRPDWEKFRRTRVESPEYILIELTNLEVEIGADGLARVAFIQTYARNGFSDQSAKRLVLEPTPDGWAIVREQSLG